MTDETDLFAKLKNQVTPASPTTLDTGLMARLQQCTSRAESSQPLDNTAMTVYSDALLERFKERLDPETNTPSRISPLETSILSKMVNSDNPDVIAAKLFVSIQSTTQIEARREKDQNEREQAKLDADYAKLQAEMGQINDLVLVNLAFDELVANYEKLSSQKKAYIVARVEEVYSEAIQTRWRRKHLISTEYILKLCDSDDKKMELILGLSVYP